MMLHRIFNRNAHIWSVKLQVSCSHLNLQCIARTSNQITYLYTIFIYISIYLSIYLIWISICCFALGICGQNFLHKSSPWSQVAQPHEQQRSDQGKRSPKDQGPQFRGAMESGLTQAASALIHQNVMSLGFGWRVPRTKPYQTCPRIQTFRI